jgi:hypothetical protein
MALFRPGSDTASGDLDPNQLWLPIFSGETYMAFEETNLFGGMVSKPVMQKGFEFLFNYFGTASSETHEAGATIVGTGIDKTQRSIYVDKRPLFTAAEFDDVDGYMAQYEFRTQVAAEHGRELARQLDKRTARLIVKAARTTVDAGFTGGGPTGNGVAKTMTGYTAGSNLARAEIILETIEEYIDRADTINLPENEQTYCAILPSVWNAMRNINSVLYVNGQNGWNQTLMARDASMPENPNPGIHAGMKRTDFLEYKGVKIYKSNNIPQTDLTSLGHSTTWGGDFQHTRGMIWKPSAVGLAVVRGVQVETWRVPDTQSEKIASSIHTGGGGLRVESAWELIKD